MAKRVIVKVGDLVAVPLAKELFGMIAVTHVFKDFKSCIAIGIYPLLLSTPESPAQVPKTFSLFPIFMGKQAITAGILPRIGKVAVPDGCDGPPEMIVAGHVYCGDHPLRIATPLEVSRLPHLLAYGHIALQHLMREHLQISTQGG